MPHTSKYFKALSDGMRLRLVHVLTQYELSVNELVKLLEAGQSRVSRHLKILAEAGLLIARRDGLCVFYSAVTDGEARAFLDAVSPFMTADMTMRADMDAAAAIMAERTLGTRQFFNAMADHWDTLNREVLGDFNLPDQVLEAMPATCGVAVDLGCGTGLVLERLRDRCVSLIGVDGSQRMLELARRRLADYANVSLRIGDLEHLPLSDHEADFASMNLVLHHIAEPARVIGEIKRVLRPGGVLFLSDFDHHSEERMRADYGDRWLGFERRHIERLLVDAGFSAPEFTVQPLKNHLALLMARATA